MASTKEPTPGLGRLRGGLLPDPVLSVFAEAVGCQPDLSEDEQARIEQEVDEQFARAFAVLECAPAAGLHQVDQPEKACGMVDG